jgi:guanylate cyclase, other
VEQFTKYKSCNEIDGFTKRARSLLVVVSTPPTTGYEEFTDKVRHYNTLPPFEFTTPTFPNKQFVKFVSIYAAYLYDSVKIYADALHVLLSKEERELSDEVIKDVASNGTAIISTVIGFKSYKSKLESFRKLESL